MGIREWIAVAGIASVAGLAAASLPAAPGDDAELRGDQSRSHEVRPVGGGFEIDAEVVPKARPQAEGWVLSPDADPCSPGTAAERGPGCGCLCGGSIFANGFESGTTAAWSGEAP